MRKHILTIITAAIVALIMVIMERLEIVQFGLSLGVCSAILLVIFIRRRHQGKRKAHD